MHKFLFINPKRCVTSYLMHLVSFKLEKQFPNVNTKIKIIWDTYLIFASLGLQALHEITSSGFYRLRVDLEDWEGNQAYAEYS